MSARRVAAAAAALALSACGSSPTAVRPAARDVPRGTAAPSVTPTARRADLPSARPAPRATLTPTHTAVGTTRPTAVPTRPVAATPPAEIALPAHDGATAMASFGGHTLLGSRRLGCVWVVRNGVRHPAVWPPGFRARFDPVRVYDSRNRLVWREGQVMEIGGGGDPRTTLVPPQCRLRTGAKWLTNSFEPVL